MDIPTTTKMANKTTLSNTTNTTGTTNVSNAQNIENQIKQNKVNNEKLQQFKQELNKEIPQYLNKLSTTPGLTSTQLNQVKQEILKDYGNYLTPQVKKQVQNLSIQEINEKKIQALQRDINSYQGQINYAKKKLQVRYDPYMTGTINSSEKAINYEKNQINTIKGLNYVIDNKVINEIISNADNLEFASFNNYQNKVKYNMNKPKNIDTSQSVLNEVRNLATKLGYSPNTEVGFNKTGNKITSISINNKNYKLNNKGEVKITKPTINKINYTPTTKTTTKTIKMTSLYNPITQKVMNESPASLTPKQEKSPTINDVAAKLEISQYKNPITNKYTNYTPVYRKEQVFNVKPLMNTNPITMTNPKIMEPENFVKTKIVPNSRTYNPVLEAKKQTEKDIEEYNKPEVKPDYKTIMVNPNLTKPNPNPQMFLNTKKVLNPVTNPITKQDIYESKITYKKPLTQKQKNYIFKQNYEYYNNQNKAINNGSITKINVDKWAQHIQKTQPSSINKDLSLLAIGAGGSIIGMGKGLYGLGKETISGHPIKAVSDFAGGGIKGTIKIGKDIIKNPAYGIGEVGGIFLVGKLGDKISPIKPIMNKIKYKIRDIDVPTKYDSTIVSDENSFNVVQTGKVKITRGYGPFKKIEEYPVKQETKLSKIGTINKGYDINYKDFIPKNDIVETTISKPIPLIHEIPKEKKYNIYHLQIQKDILENNKPPSNEIVNKIKNDNTQMWLGKNEIIVKNPKGKIIKNDKENIELYQNKNKALVKTGNTLIKNQILGTYNELQLAWKPDLNLKLNNVKINTLKPKTGDFYNTGMFIKGNEYSRIKSKNLINNEEHNIFLKNTSKAVKDFQITRDYNTIQTKPFKTELDWVKSNGKIKAEPLRTDIDIGPKRTYEYKLRSSPKINKEKLNSFNSNVFELGKIKNVYEGKSYEGTPFITDSEIKTDLNQIKKKRKPKQELSEFEKEKIMKKFRKKIEKQLKKKKDEENIKIKSKKRKKYKKLKPTKIDEFKHVTDLNGYKGKVSEIFREYEDKRPNYNYETRTGVTNEIINQPKLKETFDQPLIHSEIKFDLNNLKKDIIKNPELKLKDKRGIDLGLKTFTGLGLKQEEDYKQINGLKENHLPKIKTKLETDLKTENSEKSESKTKGKTIHEPMLKTETENDVIVKIHEPITKTITRTTTKTKELNKLSLRHIHDRVTIPKIDTPSIDVPGFNPSFGFRSLTFQGKTGKVKKKKMFSKDLFKKGVKKHKFRSFF